MTNRKGSKIKKKIQILLYGEPFTGKSTMLSQLAYIKRSDGKNARVVIIDSESGGIDFCIDKLVADGIDPENVVVYYTQSASEIRSIMAKIKKREPLCEYDENGDETEDYILDADGEPFIADALGIDGLSVVYTASQEALAEFSTLRAKVKADAANLIGNEKTVKVSGAGLELKDYQKLKMIGANLALDLLSLPCHFVVTCREADEMESKLDSKGNEVRIPTGRKLPEGFKGIVYNIPTVLRMYREDGEVFAYVDKDRTGTYSQKEVVEDPTLLNFFKVLDDNNDRDDFTLDNSLTTSVAKEYEIQTKEYNSESAENKNSSSGVASETASEIKHKILEIKNSVSASDKTKLKNELTELGLPTAYKNIDDIEMLNKCLAVFAKYK